MITRKIRFQNERITSVLKFFLTPLQGNIMLRDTACMIFKFQLNGSNKYLLNFFGKKNRLSGTCLYIILIIIKYVTINELMI